MRVILLSACIFFALFFPVAVKSQTDSMEYEMADLKFFETSEDYQWPPDEIAPWDVELLKNVICVLETSKGIIRIKLYPESAPIHSANFVKLIQDGFYDGLTFHRVIPGFVSQGGDPSGDGTGGPEYTLPAEIGAIHEPGCIAAARTGDDVNPERRSSGSQFYLVHTREQTERLDGKYTVFGIIVDGQDVNLSLQPTMNKNNEPFPDVEPDRIIKAWIELPKGYVGENYHTDNEPEVVVDEAESNESAAQE